MNDLTIKTGRVVPVELPPLPDGFTLDAQPVGTPKLPPLPEGFTLDAPVAKPVEPVTAQEPERGYLDSAWELGKSIVRGAIDTSAGMVKGQGIAGARDPRTEGIEKSLSDDFSKDLPRIPQMTEDEFKAWRQRAIDLVAATSQAPMLNQNNPADAIMPIVRQADLIRSGKAPAKAIDYKPRPDITETMPYKAGEQIEKFGEENVPVAPDVQDSISGKIASGLGSTIPFLVTSAVGGPGLGMQTGMASSTAEAVDRAVKEGATRDQVAEVARQGMFPGATETVPIETLLDRIPLPAAGKFIGAVARVLEQAAIEGGQEAVQQAWQNIVAKYNYKPEQDITEGVAEAAAIGAVIGGGMQTAALVVPKGKGDTPETPDDMPPLPEGFTLDKTITKTGRLPASESAAVEPVTSPDVAPVPRDGDEAQISPPEASSPSATAEERAILRRTAIPDDDIDMMSREEIEQKVEEARAAGVRVNENMVRKAAEYGPADVPVPAERPTAQDSPVVSPAVLSDLERAVDQSVMEDRNAQVDAAVSPIEPVLANVAQAGIEQDMATQADNAVSGVAPDLAAATEQSVAEDIARDGTRRAPVIANTAEDVDVAAQNVNVEPSEAQKEAGNYAKGHVKVSGLDVTLENPKGSVRSGTSPDGKPWSTTMPAHYGYVKGSVGRDGDQVDVYIGDNLSSKRVYVVDQKDLKTRRFDEHKAIMGVNSVTEARDLYRRSFSDQMGDDRIGGITAMSASEFKKWLRDGDTTKPLAMGVSRVKRNEAGFPVDAKGKVKKPQNLVEFVAANGGVREDKGELAAIGLTDRKTGFVAGTGPVVRSNGRPADYAREAAAEAGYLPMESSLADFYDALDEDIRSGRQRFSQYDDDWAGAWMAEQDTGSRPDEAATTDWRQEAFDKLQEKGYPGKLGDDFSERVVQIMSAGETFEQSVEYALLEKAEDLKRELEAANEPPLMDIPFFGDEASAVSAGRLPEGFEVAEQARRDDGREAAVAGEGERTGEPVQVRGESGPGRAEDNGSPAGTEGGNERGRERGAQKPEVDWPARKVGKATVYFDDAEQARVYDLGKSLLDLNGISRDDALYLEFPRSIRFGENAAEAADLLEEIGPYVETGDMPLRNVGDFARIAMHYAAEISDDVATKKGPVESPSLISSDYQRDWARRDKVKAFAPDKPAQAKRDRLPVSEETGADNKPQLVIPGAEKATDAVMAQRRADAPLKPKVAQRDAGGLFSDERDQKDLLDLSAAPSGWDMADTGDPAPLLSDTEQKRLAEIVMRTSGLTPEFVDRINVPANAPGLMAWGKGGEKGSTAAGFYSNMRDIITLALDTAPVRADKVAYHESFHRLQNLFLNDKERKLLKANDARLRKMIADNGEYAAKTVAAMSRKEIEAEAFGIWASGNDSVGIHIGVRKVWKNIKEMLSRVRNYLNGRGYQTVEDVFGKARSGEIAKRAKIESRAGENEFSIVERSPNDPKNIPEAAIGDRISTSLDTASRKVTKKLKSGNRNDRVTEDAGEGIADYAHRKLVDYLLPVKKMQDSVNADLNDLNDAYQTARLVEGTIRHEIQQVDDLYVQPMVRELAASGASLEDLHRFMYAMHAPERNRVVGLRNEEGSDLYKAATDPTVRGASGMSTNEARDTIRELAKDPEKFAALRRASGHVRAMLNESLRKQMRAGLISKEAYDRLTNQWQHYVPLRSEQDTEISGSTKPRKGKGFDVRGDEFAGATGRFTPADNVITYAINNAETSVIRQEKNRVGTAVLRFVNEFDPAGENIAQVYWSEDPKDGIIADVARPKETYRRIIGPDGKVKNRKVNDFVQRDDVLAAKVGGKTYYVKFANPQVGMALRKMTLEEITGAARLVRKVSVWQSIINTRMNPAFVPINVIRDIQTGSTLLLDEGFTVRDIVRANMNLPRAWAALWRDARGKEASTEWDRYLADFKRSGGKISFNQFNTIEDTLKKLHKDIATETGGNPIISRWKSFTKLIEDLNDTAENGFRLAAFAGARQKGRSMQNAAFMARDLTVDFQKKGEWGSELSSWYVFFNASVQGNFNLARRLRRSNAIRRVALGMMVGGMMQHYWNSLSAPDDDDGENMYLKMLREQPYKFERQLVFWIPGTKDYVSFPLAYGLNAFWHMGVQAGGMARGHVKPAEGLMNSMRVAFDAFNPIGSGDLASMIMPTIGDPALELYKNENFFGAPIYPEASPFDKSPPPDSQQSFRSTSPYFKWIAEKLNDATGGNSIEPGMVDIHPDSIEHIWGWFTGGIGRFFSQSAETAERAANLEFEPGKTPWVRSFYGQVTPDSHRSEFYSQREKVQYAKGKLKEYQDAGDKEDIADFVERNRQDVNAIGTFDIVEKQRRKINKQRRQLEKSKLPQAEIDRQMKTLDEQEMKLMNQARKAYYEAGQKAN